MPSNDGAGLLTKKLNTIDYQTNQTTYFELYCIVN
jgi:hypothetical protein